LYLQGKTANIWTIFIPLIYGLVSLGIANGIFRMVMNKKLKKAILDEKRSKIVAESVSPEIAKSLMLKK
jgi:hypothetical protein